MIDETKIAADEFQCYICKGVFTKALSEDEAEAQLADEFPGFDKSSCGIVCDDCFKGHFQ